MGSLVSKAVRDPSSNTDPNLDGISLFGLDLKFGFSRTSYHKEDKDSPNYLDIREDAGSAFLEDQPVRIPIPGVSAPSNPIFDFGAYLKFSGKFGVAYENATQKLFFEDEYVPLSKSLEGFGGLNLDAGVDFTLKSPYDSYIQVDLDVFLSYPLELKLKYEWFPDMDVLPQASREFNHGPASININFVLSVRSEEENSFNWDIIDANYNFPLTDKVFNKCCFHLDNLLNCIPCQN